MKTWDAFYKFCQQDLPGCTSFAAANELRNAAQEFFERTKVWRVDLDPVTTNASEDTYEFDIDECQLLVKVMSAKLDDQDLVLLQPGDEITMSGTASILVLDQTQFVLMTQPGARQKVYVKAIMKPSHTATGIDDRIFDQYAEAIGHGAKARLMNKPGKTYSSPALAAQEREMFESAIAKTLMQAAKGYSSAPLRTRASFI